MTPYGTYELKLDEAEWALRARFIKLHSPLLNQQWILDLDILLGMIVDDRDALRTELEKQRAWATWAAERMKQLDAVYCFEGKDWIWDVENPEPKL